MQIVLLTFAGVVAIIVGAYWLVIAMPESRQQTALRKRLKAESPVRVRADLRLLKTDDVLSGIATLDSLLHRLGGLSTPLKKTIDQAGLDLTVGRFVLFTTSSFFAAILAAQWYTNTWWLALIAGAVAAPIPLFVIRQARTRRIRKFEEQFPEAIELIARAMRAGHAFATGLKMAADETPAPCGLEFKLLYDRQNFGEQLGDALRSFAERAVSLDARFFVTAVLTQREAGGNLSEVLDRLAAVMRERFRIKREVRTRSAHGRISAYVLAGLPPGIAIMMLSSSPDQMKVLTTDPLGIRIVIVAVALQVIGTLIVRKLVDIQY
jgi:tight adherence protein B